MIETVDGLTDSRGKTDVYKIGCIVVYLFIWLDLVTNKNRNQLTNNSKLND